MRRRPLWPAALCALVLLVSLPSSAVGTGESGLATGADIAEIANIEKAAEDPAAARALAGHLHRTGRGDEAIRLLEAAIEQNPEDTSLYQVLASVYKDPKDPGPRADGTALPQDAGPGFASGSPPDRFAVCLDASLFGGRPLRLRPPIFVPGATGTPSHRRRA